MTDDTLIRRNQAWLSAWVGQEMMMMCGESGFYISLSETAGRIWDLLAEPSTVPALCHALEQEYSAEPAEIRAAVSAFMQQMLEEEILLVEPARVC